MCRRIMFLLASGLFPIMTMGANSVGDKTRNDASNKPLLKKESKLKRLVRFFTDVDTNYIANNKYHAAVMMSGEKKFTTYKLKTRNEEGREQTLEFSQRHPFRMGPYAGYSLLFLGHTFDVSTNQMVEGYTEFSLNVYSRFVGIDYTYESGNTDFKLKKITGFPEVCKQLEGMDFGGLRTYLQSWHIYYLFNNKRFSYPAAYSQTTQQLRSCGSFILGFTYAKEKVSFDYTQLPVAFVKDDINDDFKSQFVKYTDYSFSIGYAYNWVFMKNCLANISLSPTVGYNVSEGEEFNTNEKLFNLKELNFDIISRTSVVWNNGKYYVGAAMVGQTYSYTEPTFSVHNSRVTLSVYAGMNLLRKKAYRR